MRKIGLDVGDKTIGVAVSDSPRSWMEPTALRRRKSMNSGQNWKTS